MFGDIPGPVLERMEFLERIDAADWADGTPRMERLRQIPPDTGRFLAILAAADPAGAMIEIGTSAGYSALWLASPVRRPIDASPLSRFSPRRLLSHDTTTGSNMRLGGV